VSASEPADILSIDGRTVPVRLRRNGRARRIVLRIDKDGDGVVVTLPSRVPADEGIAWAHKQKTWIAERLAKLPARIPFADGAVIPFAGDDHIIRHAPGSRRGVWREDGTIFVSGRPEHLSRRVGDWLRRQARDRLVAQAGVLAGQLGMAHGRITVRDTRSRWGSCSSTGNLNFCWRLILAPADVLDYVVAHEVAHLKEPHHGPAFWQTVAILDRHADKARRWLREHGEQLHFFG